MVKNLPANGGDAGDAVQSLCWEDPLEEELEPHSSVLPWKIPWIEGHTPQTDVGHLRTPLSKSVERV